MFCFLNVTVYKICKSYFTVFVSLTAQSKNIIVFHFLPVNFGFLLPSNSSGE